MKENFIEIKEVEVAKNFYFKTPVWHTHNHNFLEEFNNISDEYLKKPNDKNIGKFSYVNHSENLLKDQRFHKFLDYVGTLSGDFLVESGFDLKKYMPTFTELWVQEFPKAGGGYHSCHVHYNQHVSGFYFLKCSNRTSYPIFHDPRSGALATKLPEIDATKITEANASFHIKPTPGSLILFPGYIAHEFVVDPGLDDFRFMHFNLQAVQNEV